ncbi:hypothetical protein QQF64_012187 [Cirrhinus molitorella]|uniref:SCAN box domain-containing protein n=1 Tax=Cirrhinus molitorella TaxID=172907 RepID=A0ABR3LUQ3_9TELE
MSDTADGEDTSRVVSRGDVVVGPLSVGDEDPQNGIADAEAEGEPEAKAGLPPFDPFSPSSVDSRGDARLKVCLARLQYEAQERAQTRQAELNLRLEIRRLEIEADKQVKLRQLRQLDPQVTDVSPLVDSSSPTFDVSKHVALVPQFRVSEVDSYFNAFERIATSLRWPKDVWPLLVQWKLFGKALEVCSTLSLEESLKYEAVKSAILRAYELVPEAYRQKFRGHKKNSTQTFVEFA